MTKKEYEELLKKASLTYNNYTRSAMRKLKKVYEDAARMAAVAMRKARKAGRADITIESWNQLYISLRQGAQLVQEAIEKQIPLSSYDAVAKVARINTKYIIDAVKEAGTDKITRLGVNNMFFQINDRIIRSIAFRIYQDGYSFSQRVWQAGQYYQEQIKRVVSTGLAQGRDVIKIAKDIQVYVKKGKSALANRYGELVRPAKEFMKRLGNKVDYQALRLVRSELYASIQQAGKEQGHINPACTDMYDWIKNTSAHWDCVCPELEEGSPYEYHNVPDYPHPNCLCTIKPVLRDHKTFVNDLVSWTEGNQVPYIDNWYNNIYSYTM